MLGEMSVMLDRSPVTMYDLIHLTKPCYDADAGLVPAEISSLSKLKVLVLSRNRLKGEVRDLAAIN